MSADWLNFELYDDGWMGEDLGLSVSLSWRICVYEVLIGFGV